MALSKRWHEAQEPGDYAVVTDCQGPVTSCGCIPTSVLQFPRHESLIAEPHRPC